MSTVLNKINTSKLSGSDRVKLQNPLPLHFSFNAFKFGNLDKVTKQRTEKATSVSCKLITETYPDESTAIQFTFLVNEYIKADNRMGIKNLDGKPVKSDVEIWHPARVYKFSNEFILSVENYTDGLFPTDGYIENYPTYKTRADVAMLFETLIKHGSFQFLKFIEKEDGTLYMTSVCDPSILLLFELLEVANAGQDIDKNDGKYNIKVMTYQPIDETKILECFINAANKAKEQLPLIDGMLLHTLNNFATEQQKILTATSIATSTK